jgi:histone acetyltransferase (RNA polymerase elongator complex component)
MSARKTAEIGPSLARLYPTIVLDDTRLYEMYVSGEYVPLTREEAVLRTKEMYKILDDAGITIMRVGLKSTDIIGEGGAINGGTYHPAFRQLLEGEIAKERIEPLLEEALRGRTSVISIWSNKRWFSNMVGHKACNKQYFSEKYTGCRLRFRIDDSLEDGIFKVTTD